MVYEWSLSTSTNSASVSDWKHFSSPEDGARKTKGWFKVIAPDEDSTFNSNTFSGTFASTDADDETERWYYADGSGDLYYGAIKKIKDKYYGFRPDDGKKGGAMLSGLVLMKVETDGSISDILDDGVDADDLSDILDGTTTVPTGYSLYYFGSDADSDGAMKTGSTTITLDGDSYNFNFSKSGGVEGKGKGVSGIDDNKYIYMYGCRIKADSDDKYQLVSVTGTDKGIGSSTAVVAKEDSRNIRTNHSVTSTTRNKDDEYVRYAGVGEFTDMYLVNSSGSIVKSKTAAKDGADWYFYVDGYEVKLYTNNKVLTNAKDANGELLTTWKTVDIQ